MVSFTDIKSIIASDKDIVPRHQVLRANSASRGIKPVRHGMKESSKVHIAKTPTGKGLLRVLHDLEPSLLKYDRDQANLKTISNITLVSEDYDAIRSFPDPYMADISNRFEHFVSTSTVLDSSDFQIALKHFLSMASTYIFRINQHLFIAMHVNNREGLEMMLPYYDSNTWCDDKKSLVPRFKAHRDALSKVDFFYMQLLNRIENLKNSRVSNNN